MTYQTLRGIGPGIDISHYGAPYKQMLGVPALGAYTEQPGMDYEYATAGLGEMLYRYGAGLGVEPWTGAPAEDPRMVKRYTKIRATYAVSNVPSDRAAEAAQRILYQGRQLFQGHNVSKIGTTGWTSGGRVGYEVILATPMRAGEIKQKNYQAGVRASAGMGGNARLHSGQTSIPQSGFEAAPPTAPSTPETTPSQTPSQNAAAAQTGLNQRVGGIPIWGLGLIGIGVVGGVTVLVMSRKKKAVAANRRRRRRRRRSSRRRR
jgi:hypothetical protein